MAREGSLAKVVGLAIVGLVVVGVVWLVRGSSSLPDTVQPIEWDRQPCAHCQMLIGEPHHAAQLITRDGDVLSFDDPGCAIRFLSREAPAIHRLWFHHGTADRWVASDQVVFTTGKVTPMGSGLVVVDRGTPGAIDLAAATRATVDGGTP